MVQRYSFRLSFKSFVETKSVVNRSIPPNEKSTRKMKNIGIVYFHLERKWPIQTNLILKLFTEKKCKVIDEYENLVIVPLGGDTFCRHPHHN
ncbi:hypothetical protein MTR_1g078230 [Medicago truncatula]|uniref:Uncharacterized protein n=1 Tax=Medicago truncatula TaxID=3880 RepID=A0A072VNG4_MEDTR|nr:hypothetical protein MTR_1g078230 [Medicago truncatula]